MLRIGEISYLNCTPIFSVLKSRFRDDRYTFVSGTPAELNELLRRGEIDLCPSSSIEYARNHDSYVILPGLSISAEGPVKSVMLFTRRPIEELDGATVLLTSESETSVALVKILLSRMYSLQNSFCRAEPGCVTLQDQCDALLLIGDAALRASGAADGCYVYDLGELWFQFTGLPFVFALWLLRRDAFARDCAAVKLLHERLVVAKLIALDNYRQIADFLEKKEWTTSEFLTDYWQTISYELTPRHIEGLRLFYSYAAELSLTPCKPPVNLLGDLGQYESSV